jgi:hypothetical protein
MKIVSLFASFIFFLFFLYFLFFFFFDRCAENFGTSSSPVLLCPKQLHQHQALREKEKGRQGMNGNGMVAQTQAPAQRPARRKGFFRNKSAPTEPEQARMGRPNGLARAKSEVPLAAERPARKGLFRKAKSEEPSPAPVQLTPAERIARNTYLDFLMEPQGRRAVAPSRRTPTGSRTPTPTQQDSRAQRMLLDMRHLQPSMAGAKTARRRKDESSTDTVLVASAMLY